MQGETQAPIGAWVCRFCACTDEPQNGAMRTTNKGKMIMKINDALSILKLQIDATIDEVASAYKFAAKKYHPDINPAGAEMMKMINVAYETLKERGTATSQATTENYADALNDALNAIIDLDGLNIEICGAWIWVGGNTKAHRKALKAAGFSYASKKQKWNYRPAGWKSSSRGGWSMQDIRNGYGSVRPTRKANSQPDKYSDPAGAYIDDMLNANNRCM
ncbi:MAG: J domain-containing protein [Hyphomicrobiales bacterium]|nr:J domain-containing protein [Hyphomicrobiales bacterium]